jgi:multimeric flavodoxin WrbA
MAFTELTRPAVLVLNGAVREAGATDAVVRALAAGLRSGGALVRTVNLRELRIADCLGCCQCRDERSCYFADDMNGLRAAVMGASLIVFASPLYFSAVTGLMKTFLDRLYFFYHDVNRQLTRGKKALVVTTLGEPRTAYETRPLIEFYRRYLKALGMRRVGLRSFPDLTDKDGIRRHPEYLKDARQYAKKIASGIK